MPKCCGSSCACRLLPGPAHMSITGTGTQQDPFVLDADVDFNVVDSASIDLALTGTGTTSDPWVLAAGFGPASRVGQLGDVNIPTNPPNGYVIAWNSSTSTWHAVAPTTASAGAVSHDTSLLGDGSSGTPLGVKVSGAGGLESNASGIAMQATILNQLVRSFLTDTERATITPELNTFSVLDANPGQLDYWDGTQWVPFLSVSEVSGQETLALSGPYDGRPVQILVKQITTVTDGSGVMDVLTAADIGSYVGVLSAHFQETGPTPYKGVLTINASNIQATCYRLDDGSAYAGATLSGFVTAYLY